MKSLLKAIPVYLLVLRFFTADAAAGGRIVSFGYSTEVPARSEGMTAVAAGYMHSLALTEQGEVVAWGDDSQGQAQVPSTCRVEIQEIAAGGYHSLAVDKSGQVFAWGDNSAGQTTVPNGCRQNIRAVSAGLLHSLALHKGGRVYAWGDAMFGQIYVPSGLDRVIAISAGALHSMALRNDGLVVVWGDNSFGQAVVPERAMSGIKAISAGYFHNLALTEAGEVIAWGDNTSGQCNVPAEARYGVVSIAAGQDHSLALKANGQLISWGGRSGRTLFNDSSTIPSLSAISAGGFHSLGIVPEEVDSNQNGIPDWWEIQNNLDPAAAVDLTVDSDGDGMTDHEEFLTGTDPWDDASFFRMELNVDPTTGKLTVSFSPVSTERAYSVEYATDVKRNAWRASPGLANIRVASNTEPVHFALDASKDVRVFRIRITPP